MVYAKIGYPAATGPGDLFNNEMCMQEQAGYNLNCTANDVAVSGIADVNGELGLGPDGVIDEYDITFFPVCDAMASNAGADCSSDANICTADGSPAPELCGDACAYPGDTTKFSATFIFELSAQERFDVGAYFETGLDTAGDGALTGSCSIITLPEDNSPFMRPDGTMGNFVDLDTGCKGGSCPQPGDLCGDINDDNNPVYYDMQGSKAVVDSIEAVCVDSDGDGLLNLPNCTSWRQSGANEVCLDPTQAFPGSPSKCNCDPDFQLPISVPAASLTVVKTATPTSVNEPGDQVRFDVSVTNMSPFASVTINSGIHSTNSNGLDDDIYGDITQVQGLISSTTCSVPQTLAAGGSYSCHFYAAVNGLGDTSQTDIVIASGKDENGNDISGSDDATVDIVDVLPNMSLVKTANPISVMEPGGNVEFTVIVTNTSTVDALALTALSDDIYGDLNGQGTCSVPQMIVVGGNYSCQFTKLVSGPPLSSQTDTITATANDDEGNVLVRTDPATVDILNAPSMCTLTKIANPVSINEPGGDVEFTVLITNNSSVDAITINSLTDSVHGDLSSQGDCGTSQVIAAAGGSYTCSFTANVSGLGNTSETDTVTASGMDDDGAAVMCSDSVTVNILDVQPAASLAKEAIQAIATYKVVVTNDSTVEALTLDALSDDQFGDITMSGHDGIQSTTCLSNQIIAVGETYMCTFIALVDTSPHTNTVNATVSDDEGNTVTPNPSDSVTIDLDD
jgi:uncharacterized repeat protein (TIGR01451 family)